MLYIHTHTHTYMLVYMNLMVTTNQKPITDMQKNKEKRIQTEH